jgi:hypothetical protein
MRTVSYEREIVDWSFPEFLVFELNEWDAKLRYNHLPAVSCWACSRQIVQSNWHSAGTFCALIYSHICAIIFIFCFFIPSDTLFSRVALGHASSTTNDVAATFHSRWHPRKAIRSFSSHCALISEAVCRWFSCPNEWQGGHWVAFRDFKH